MEDTEVKDGLFVLPVVLRGKFKWGQRNLDLEISKGTKVSIKTKAFSPSYEKAEYDPEVPWNLIDRTFGVETNENAGSQLKDILGKNAFDFPKPVSLIKYLINFIKARYVLDFFAGSGTTLHAVMQLNAEDGGHRQCILCTNNENGICENVTYERNKRVIEGYTKPNGEHVEGLHDNNLRYYRTEFVSRDRSTKNMRRLVHLATDMLCIKENIYIERKRFADTPTYRNIYRYFEDHDGKMLIIYDERYIGQLVDLIAKVETEEKIKVYVFSPSEDPWQAAFEPVMDKVELCALPQAIYNAYKRVLPKRRPEPVWTRFIASTETASDSDVEDYGGLFNQERNEE